MQKSNNKEIILLYNIKGKPYAPRLKSILLRLGIRIKVITAEQYHLPIKDLLSANSSASHSMEPSLVHPPTFDDEMIVMAGLNNTRLDLFLSSLRKEGIQIPLKAILTPSNSEWSSYTLHDELTAEHAKMQEINRQ